MSLINQVLQELEKRHAAGVGAEKLALAGGNGKKKHKGKG